MSKQKRLSVEDQMELERILDRLMIKELPVIQAALLKTLSTEFPRLAENRQLSPSVANAFIQYGIMSYCLGIFPEDREKSCKAHHELYHLVMGKIAELCASQDIPVARGIPGEGA